MWLVNSVIVRLSTNSKTTRAGGFGMYDIYRTTILLLF